MSDRRVVLLVIDDDADDRYAIRRLARDVHGWEIEVLEAGNRREAIAVLAEHRVDVILLDYLLGAETGLDLLEWLCTHVSNCPVVVTTGQGDEHVATEFMKAGAQDYLIKSQLTPHLLHRAVDRAIAHTNLQREKGLLEEQVRQLQKMEAVTTLAGGLAHDFNNILTGILGHVQLGMMARDLEKVDSHLEAIERDCQRMADLIRRLMAFNEPSVQRTRSLSLRNVVEEMLVLVEHMLKPGVVLKSELSDAPLMLEASAGLLHQVILNLVTNAIEAMEPAGGTLTIVTREVEEPLGREPGQTRAMARLEVRDTGRGIDAGIAARVFDPFFTTKPLTATKGSGLGLAVVWQVVHSLGGTVRVESAPGTGAAFLITLPLAESGQGVELENG